MVDLHERYVRYFKAYVRLELFLKELLSRTGERQPKFYVVSGVIRTLQALENRIASMYDVRVIDVRLASLKIRSMQGA